MRPKFRTRRFIGMWPRLDRGPEHDLKCWRDLGAIAQLAVSKELDTKTIIYHTNRARSARLLGSHLEAQTGLHLIEALERFVYPIKIMPWQRLGLDYEAIEVARIANKNEIIRLSARVLETCQRLERAYVHSQKDE